MKRKDLVMSSEAQRSRDTSHFLIGSAPRNSERFVDCVSLRFTPLGMTKRANASEEFRL